MGTNDSLASLDSTAEEEFRAEASGGRSEASKHRRPFRGAPPSSLSQPILSDHSRSSSPSKSSRTPSIKLSTNPSSSKSRTSATCDLSRDDTSLRRGKPSLVGRGVGFRHHRFLPQTIPSNSTVPLSFQPQFPSSETHYTPSSYRAFEFKTPAPISPTTDISVTGEILPSPSISQQLSASPASTVESNPIENSTTSMSTITESTLSQTLQAFHPETERGYEDSPMARLIAQYKACSDDDISTLSGLLTFLQKNPCSKMKYWS